MLESSSVCPSAFWPFGGSAGLRLGMLVVAAALAACATPEAVKPPEPAPVVKAQEPAAPDPSAQEQAAKAMLAQAETDIQRARAKRALWLKAWESLVLARQAAAAKDSAATVTHSRRASELAQLGLEQLAYPAVN